MQYTTHMCSALQCVAVRCSVSQFVAVCCSVSQCVAVCCSALQCVAVRCSVSQCAAVCCSVSQCVAVCRSLLQCVAVCCTPWHLACCWLDIWLFWWNREFFWLDTEHFEGKLIGYMALLMESFWHSTHAYQPSMIWLKILEPSMIWLNIILELNETLWHMWIWFLWVVSHM